MAQATREAFSERQYILPGARASFGGIDNVVRYSDPQLTRRRATLKLSGIDAYTRHREPKPIKHNPIFIHRLRELIQADLCDKQYAANANDGIKYWLIIEDTFSRKIWLATLKTKNAAEVCSAFRRLLREISLNGVPERCLSDRGAEFRSQQFKQLMSEFDISHSFPIFHAPHVERVQRTLQSMVAKYQTSTENERYVHILDDIVKGYNNRRHRIIQMTPNQAERTRNHNDVRRALSIYYDKSRNRAVKPKFKVGDWVRVKNVRGKFFRSYQQTFGWLIYEIIKVHAHMPRPMYEIRNSANEVMADKYYQEELQLVGGEDGELFKVHSVIGRRRNPRTRAAEVKVRWEGFVENTGSWIPASSLENIA